MESYLRVLLALALGTVVNAASLMWPLRDTNQSQFISEAIGVYNRKSHSAFKLFKDEYEYKLGPNGQKEAKFTIKETVCDKPEDPTTQRCEFKAGGLEKNCSASMNGEETTFSVVCSTITDGATKDPGSGDLESSSHLEDDNPDQQEVEAISQERTIVIKERYKETFLERHDDDDDDDDDDDEKRIIDEFLLPKIETSDDKELKPRTGKKKLYPGPFLGRVLCFECLFDILSKT